MNKIDQQTLKQSLKIVFKDAYAYFNLETENAASGIQAEVARVYAREYQAGLEQIDLIINVEDDTFWTHECASDVIQSLENFLMNLDQKRFPMLAWRVGGLLEVIYSLGYQIMTQDGLPETVSPPGVTLH